MEYDLIYYYLVVQDLKIILEGRCAKAQRIRLINDLKEFSIAYKINDYESVIRNDDLDIDDLNMIISKIHIFYDYLVSNKLFPYTNAFIQENPVHDVSNLKADFCDDFQSFPLILVNSYKVQKLKTMIETKHYSSCLNDALSMTIDILFYNPHSFTFEELWELIEALLEFHLLHYKDSSIEKETDEGFAEFYYREYSIDLNSEK